MAGLVYVPTNNAGEVPFPHVFANIFFCRFDNNYSSRGYDVCPGFDLHFPKDQWGGAVSYTC